MTVSGGIAHERGAPPWRIERPYVMALVGLTAGLLLVALLFRSRSVESMDVRTYVQMTRAIAERGIPAWDNGPVDSYAGLIVPWAVPVDGLVWGVYAPVYPYLAAPFFAHAGISGCIGVALACCAFTPLATFLLAREFTSPRGALLAAALVVCTPISSKAFEATAFPLAVLLATLATWASVRALRSFGPLWSVASALLWATAIGAHVLCAPMAIGTLMAFVWVGRPRVAAHFAFAFACGLLPLAWFNHLRFHSWNPISYGPMPWPHVDATLTKMTLADQLRYSGPLLAIAGVTGAIAVMTRRRRWVSTLVLGAAIVVLCVVPILRERAVRHVLLLVGYLLDMTPLEMSAYPRAADGIGRTFHEHVPKALLQATPIAMLAPLAWRQEGRRAGLLWLPVLALFGSLFTRANLPYADALGWPVLNLRYTFPALPLLAVSSAVVVERAQLRRAEWIGVLALVAVGAWLIMSTTVGSLPQRVLVLIVPLALGCAALVCVARDARGLSARLSAGAALAWSAALALGHDLAVELRIKEVNDALVAQFASAVPERFALLGVPGQFDVWLSTTASRDVLYADGPSMSRTQWTEIFRRCRADARPVFIQWLVYPPTAPGEWTAEAVPGVEGLYRVVWQSP